MAQPQAYDRDVDFTERDGDDTNHAGINAELDAAALSINQIRQNLALIQKDDGSLANGIVGADQLAPSALDAVLGAAQEATQDAETAANNATLAASTALSARDTAVAARDQAVTANNSAQFNAQSAATSATAAANSATQATINGAAAATAAIRDIYYGPLASDPTLDPNGNPVQTGDLYWNTTSNNTKVYTGTAWVDVAQGTSTPTQVFSGTGLQTAFTLSSTPGSLGSLEVFISGIRQVPTTNYTVSGTTLTFSVAPPAGTSNIFVRWISTQPISVPADASVTTSKLADDAVTPDKVAPGTYDVNISGNAATATALQTARTINGVSFNGSADITLPTVNTTGDQTIDGVKTFNQQIVASGGVTGNVTGNVAGNGSALTNLNASNIASGTVPTARLGSGTANNTTFLRGDGQWAAPLNTTVTAGNNYQFFAVPVLSERAGTSSTSLVRVCSLRIRVSGTVNVQWAFGGSMASTVKGSRVYINGVAVGTERTTTVPDTPSIVTETVTVNAGDRIEIWGRHAGGNAMFVQAFNLGIAEVVSFPIATNVVLHVSESMTVPGTNVGALAFTSL